MTPIDRRFLILDLAFLGDTLMTTPVITNLRRNHPHALIDFLVSSQSAVVVEHHPDLNEVIVVDKARWKQHRPGDLLDLAARLREKRYDTAIVVHRSLQAALVAFLAKIPRRVGLNTQGRSWLLTDAVPLEIARHRTDNALALLEHLGEEVEDRTLSFCSAPGAAQRAEGVLRMKGWEPERLLVLLAPGGAWPTKRWSAERYARTAQVLYQAGYQVGLVGGPDETVLGEGIEAQAGVPLINLVGRTRFDELYEVFRRAAGVIANDSGPMHLAAAAGVPLVGVFGPTSPARCGPRSVNATTITGEVPCLGCYFKQCDHLSCMAYLGVRPVIEALEQRMVAAGTIALAVPEPEPAPA